MIIELRDRTANSVITYFRATRDPEVQKYLPQKAATEMEALADFERTQQPGAASYGRTIYADGSYVGDVWCYCIQQDTPNAMVSYCIFNKSYWNKGIAARALQLFLSEIADKFCLKSIGAFTYSANEPSVRVLCKNRFAEAETFVEDGIESKYFQKDLHGEIGRTGQEPSAPAIKHSHGAGVPEDENMVLCRETDRIQEAGNED